MERTTLEGHFWRVDSPEHRVAGSLHFGGVDSAELSLIGSLNPSDFPGYSTGDVIRIIGEAQGKTLTLDGCFLIGNRSYSGTGTQERYYVATILSGAAFSDSEPLEFVGANLFLQHLDEWSGLCCISNDHTSFSKGEGAITYTRPQTSSIRTYFGELELWSNFNVHSDRFKQSVEQIYGFTIRLDESQPLTKVMQLGSALQDLLTICTDTTAAITRFSLRHSELKLESPAGDIRYTPIELHVQHRGNHALSDSTRILHPRMLVTFDQLGGIDGVGRWVDCASKYEGVLSALLSHRYIPMMYTDNRFGDIVTAAEALTRIRYGKQNLKLQSALKSLAMEAGEPFRALVQDVNSWTKCIVTTRTNNVVHRGLHENEAPDLYALSESVYFLVVMCLLRECGVDIDTSTDIGKTQVFTQLSSDLQRAL